MTTHAKFEQQISKILASTDPDARSVHDVTARVLEDASHGPGEVVRMIAEARPAAPGILPPTLLAELRRVRSLPDQTMGSGE